MVVLVRKGLGKRAISYAIVKSQVLDYYGMEFSMEDSSCALSMIVLSRMGHLRKEGHFP